jgi:hypothetical protein
MINEEKIPNIIHDILAKDFKQIDILPIFSTKFV